MPRRTSPVVLYLAMLLIVSMALQSQPLTAFAAEADRGWSLAVSPYLWLPSIEGTLRYSLPLGAGRTVDIGVGAEDYLDNLEFAFPVGVEARRGPWFAATDVLYLSLSSEESQVKSVDFTAGRVPLGPELDAGTGTSLKNLVWTLVLGRAIVQKPRTEFNAFAGFRYMGLDATTDWRLTTMVPGPGGGETFAQTGTVSEREDLWDAIVGVRARMGLGGSPWFVPCHLDLGTGSSEVTWQAVAGFGYTLGKVDLTLAYRHLSYEQDESKLVQDLSMSGAGIGATIRF